MVLADVFAHQNFRKQKTPDMPDSPPSAPEPDSPSSVYRDGVFLVAAVKSRSGR